MLKAIIFDFWGTLVETGTSSPIRQVKDILRLRLSFPAYVTRMEEAMMTKPFPTLKEAFTAVFQEFELPENEWQLQELVGMWNKSWMLAQPYPEAAKILSELQRKYQLILISNTDSTSIPKVLEKFQLHPYFAKTYFSYEMGLLKTNPTFFQKILQEKDLTAEECVMIGDSLESDMKAAKAVGMRGILVDRKDKREFTPKIKSLEELEQHL